MFEGLLKEAKDIAKDVVKEEKEDLMKKQLEIRKKALSCSIKGTITIGLNRDVDITVAGTDPDQVIKGFKEFEKKVRKLK